MGRMVEGGQGSGDAQRMLPQLLERGCLRGCALLPMSERRSRVRTRLGTVVVLPLALVCVAPAFARPEGARVVAGTATVSKLDAATTLVTQTAERAVIEWQGLTLAANERLVLRQPGPSAMTVLRVVGDEPCRVSGRLQANGQVLLTNPRGVEFGEACRNRLPVR